MSASAQALNSAWIDVAGVHEIPPLGARTLQLDGRKIAVFRNAEDQYFALDDACPHRGGPLSQGIVSGCKVYCPLHNWCIALDSGAALAPDEGLTGSYPLRIDGDRLLIQIGG